MPDRQRPSGTSIIFVNTSEKVLLILRDDRGDIAFPNCWDVPGGGVEGAETPLECIKREMLEELELVLDDPDCPDRPDRPELFHIYELDDRREYTFWQLRNLDLEAIPLHEGQRLQWFSQDDIAHLPDQQVAFSFKPILLEFFQKRPWR